MKNCTVALMLCVTLLLVSLQTVFAEENSESYIQERVTIAKDDAVGTIWWDANIESGSGANGTWYFLSTSVVKWKVNNTPISHMGGTLVGAYSLSPLFNRTWTYQSYWNYYPGDGRVRTAAGATANGLTISAG